MSSNPLEIIDISNITPTTSNSILKSLQTQGFLFLDGHDFTQAEVDHLFCISKQFFSLATQHKQQYAIDSEDRGYATFRQENLDPDVNKVGDPKEAFNFGGFNFTTGDASNKSLPSIFTESENKIALQTISKKLYALSIKVLKAIAIALEISPEDGGSDWFGVRHAPEKTSMSTFRLLHYPSVSSMDSNQEIRAGAHTDYGSLTLLFQQKGQEGLQLFEPNASKDTDGKGTWSKVPFVESPNADYRSSGKAAPIVMNIADQLSFWTNGLLRSTLHRVVMPVGDVDRYSVVFFFDANNETELVPIPSKLVKESEGKGKGIEAITGDDGKPLTTKEYMLRRFKATYSKGH
ncbi:hypothetical protein WICPIJ_001564 [Wickerhamomyces pijperi]|uniref:Fe2OG dioxygenase domain-containing protein n=1 Tax=Wickerhamomyces pijperi TaxID=599730 RepID=A0A9P8TQN5_WICPI|nr:hypothetical protein WICPIJ_001564 [Wickerhamomyces pijperi]